FFSAARGCVGAVSVRGLGLACDPGVNVGCTPAKAIAHAERAKRKPTAMQSDVNAIRSQSEHLGNVAHRKQGIDLSD
ncbi:MAG TPA: hypothetical protein PLS90_08270, partial [Candidatus Sumerlaeota bacterium]|nr:hypothetical protein [Candidatus Sumerlaeota bacterium]